MTIEEMDAFKKAIKEEIHEEIARKNGIGTMNKAALWGGLLVSLINAGTLLWKGGELSGEIRRVVSDQAATSIEVQALKSSATGGAREYMASTDQWKIAMDKRVSRVEDIAMGIPGIAADVQIIKNLVTEHMKNGK